VPGDRRTIIAFDLGTGGNKASLYGDDGTCLESVFDPYPTTYPRAGWHEQRPADWWDAVVRSCRSLMEKRAEDRRTVSCIAISGHSLGAVPLDGEGKLLRETTPIWSDTRAQDQAARFFSRVEEKSWYMITGNGFPPPCYTVFKVMWYRDNEPDMFGRVQRILGTKDYINYLLTGAIRTDYSYASGSGVYNLKEWGYDGTLLEASDLEAGLFPDIVPSSEVVGSLTADAAEKLGLAAGVPVVAGGVDNSCMAVGAKNIAEGRVYTSLGSSSWIAVSSTSPVLDPDNRPFVFTHVIPGFFTSAVSIFSAGSSLAWVRDTLCPDLVERAREERGDPYELMTELAATSPPGAKKLLFNPNLAGGSALEKSPHVRGAFAGIDLGHTRADVIRATMEGIALNLGSVLQVLKDRTEVGGEMVMVGGGSRSSLWLQIFADVYGMEIVKTNIDQDAGSLGAAAIGAVGSGLWEDFTPVDRVHRERRRFHPVAENAAVYDTLRPPFERLRESQSDLGDLLHGLDVPH
jgi:xylulokinase